MTSSPTLRALRRELSGRRAVSRVMGDMYPDMAKLLPPAKHGDASLSHVVVTESMARLDNLTNAMRGAGYLYVEPGTYARLVVNDTLMMTDTPMERRSNRHFVHTAHGRVLVAGLGIGMILHAVLRKKEVTHVTVLEKYADVVALVAPSLAKYRKRLTIVTTDVHDYRPAKGELFDVVYFDIWPTISTDNLPEIATLHRRAARWVDRENPRRWVGSWMAEQLRYNRDRERRSGW